MRPFLKALCLIFMTIGLVACGGGGGSSSGGTPSGGTPAPVVTDTLSLSQGAITFSGTQFEANPTPVTVTATITGSNTAGIVFGTLPGVASLPSWLNIELGSLVNNSVDAVFNITTSDLPAGTYNFTVRAVTFDSSDRVLDTADVVVTYEIAEGVPISVSPSSVDVIMHYASDPVEQVMSVTAGNYTWNAFSSEANLDIEEGVGSQDVTLSIIPAMEGLVDENGMFQGAVDVFQNGTSNHALFFINYTMFPTLESRSDSAFLNAVAGNSNGGEAGINLRGNGLEWSASSNASWLILSATAGTIQTEDDIIDSPDGDDFGIRVDGSTLTEGRHETIITITANADQTLEILVTVEVASQKLEPARRGIAMSQTATTATLQSVVDINTNAERIANWTASSNAAWLSVTASGTVADNLTLTADPTLLANETLSEAFVTLSSPDSEISETETIRVGFWKSAQSPSDTPTRVGGMFPEDLIVTDPVRPLAYVHSGEREINIVNVYSGNIEKTLTPVAQVFNFAVSDDGAFLYLVRSGEGEGFIDVVDLETQEISTTWTYPVDRLTARDTQDIAFGRITNRPHLFISSGVILNADSGGVETLAAGTFPTGLDVKSDRFCNQGTDVSNFDSEFECFDLVSAGFDGARLTSVSLSEATIPTGQSRLTQDGGRVFGIADRTLSLLDTSDLSLLATISTAPEDFVEDAVLDGNDNLYVTYRNDGDVPIDPADPLIDPRRFLTIYDKDLILLRTVDYPSDGAGGILPILSDTKLSGDDQRVVYLTSDEFLDVQFFSLD
ncbi:MAG: hypothetical protein ABJN22_13630 [Litorimonas sp.]